jgi:hypothetical protein
MISKEYQNSPVKKLRLKGCMNMMKRGRGPPLGLFLFSSFFFITKMTSEEQAEKIKQFRQELVNIKYPVNDEVKYLEHLFIFTCKLIYKNSTLNNS